jgi:hypothetical protein
LTSVLSAEQFVLLGELNITSILIRLGFQMNAALAIALILILSGSIAAGVVIENNLVSQQNNNNPTPINQESTDQTTPSSQMTQSLASNTPSPTNSSSAHITKDIFAEIDIKMPSYTIIGDGPFLLDVSVEYYTFTHTNGSVEIPYQDFKCIYQVDGSDWREATLVGDVSKNWVMSLVNNGGWTEVFCNYSVALQGLSNGLHLVNVTAAPSDVIWSHDSHTSSTDSSIFLSVQDQRFFCCRLLRPENSTGGNPNILDWLETEMNAPASWMTYSLDGQTNSTFTKETKMPAVSYGSHFLTIYASDVYGTVTRSNTVWFSVEL